MPLFFLLVFAFLLSPHLISQDTVRIPTTNLYTVLPDGFSLEGPDAIITGPDFVTTIMELPATAFDGSVGEPEKLKQQYEESNVVLESFRTDTLAGTVHHYLSTLQPRRVYQVFFGNANFVAIATMEPIGGNAIDTLTAQRLIHGLEYRPSAQDPLEEHARFTLDRANFPYELKTFMNTMFGFEGRDSQSMLLVMQVPAGLTNEALAQQLLAGMTNKGISLTTIEAGEVTIGPFTGYRLLVTPSRPEQSQHLKAMSVFATSNADTQLLFQLMHKEVIPDQAQALNSVVKHFQWR